MAPWHHVGATMEITLDKNGSLYDPAGTESWNMQIWSWIVSTSTIFSKIFQIHRRHSRRNNPNNRKYTRRNNPNNRKYNRRHDLGENTEEGSDASKTDCGNKTIVFGVLSLAPCYVRKCRYVILASQNDFTLLNRRLRWPESCWEASGPLH